MAIKIHFHPPTNLNWDPPGLPHVSCPQPPWCPPMPWDTLGRCVAPVTSDNQQRAELRSSIHPWSRAVPSGPEHLWSTSLSACLREVSIEVLGRCGTNDVARDSEKNCQCETKIWIYPESFWKMGVAELPLSLHQPSSEKRTSILPLLSKAVISVTMPTPDEW